MRLLVASIGCAFVLATTSARADEPPARAFAIPPPRKSPAQAAAGKAMIVLGAIGAATGLALGLTAALFTSDTESIGGIFAVAGLPTHVLGGGLMGAGVWLFVDGSKPAPAPPSRLLFPPVGRIEVEAAPMGVRLRW